MEWKLQDTNYPSTFEFHEHRDRANHLAQQAHTRRLKASARMIADVDPMSVADLGCGDGGLLKLLNNYGITAWGYDFTPANVSAATQERQVDVQQIDVFNTRTVPQWAELVVMTEVLEHLADPHDVLEWVSENTRYILVSSPADENPDVDQSTDPCHIWAWDWQGYEDLVNEHFHVLRHERVEWSQLILAESRQG